MHPKRLAFLLVAAGLFAAAVPAAAEPPLEFAQLYPVYPGYRVYEAPPPPRFALPRREVAAVVRSLGLRPVDRPRRRGRVYLVNAVTPQGHPARVVVDRYSGEVLEVTRFGPSYRAVAPDARQGPTVIRRAPDMTGIAPRPSPDIRRAAPLPPPRPGDAPALVRQDAPAAMPPAPPATAVEPAEESPAEQPDENKGVDWPPVQPLE